MLINQSEVVLGDGRARDLNHIVVLVHIQNAHIVEEGAIEAAEHDEGATDE